MDTARKFNIGDCFVSNSRSGVGLFRLMGDYNGNIGTLEKYSFIREVWEEDHRVSNNDLNNYYKKLDYQVERLLENERLISSGQPMLVPEKYRMLLTDSPVFNEIQEETLSLTTSAQSLEDISKESIRLQEYVECVSSLAKARLEEQLRALKSSSHPLNIAIRKLSVQVDVLKKACDILKIYLGENVNITVVSEGKRAADTSPVTFRQRILFMDEEMAVLGDDNKGLDAGDIHLFAEWLKVPAHRDIILPEDKCVVVMKPRRYIKQYTSDWNENRKLNEWNFHSFIVIRNGENVNIIESDNLCIYDSALPKKNAIDQIKVNRWLTDNGKEDAVRNLTYRTMLLAQAIQGIADKTDFFEPAAVKMSVKNNEGIAFVFDDEDDTLLGTGIVPFKDWVKSKSDTIRRGSRVLYIPGFSGGRTTKYYRNKLSQPSAPKAGIYQVVSESYGLVTFMYKPERMYSDSTRSERWEAGSSLLVNFDEVSSEEIERYLKDRTQRKHYEALIPLLVEYKKLKEKEETEERWFREIIKRDPSLTYVPSDEQIDEAIRWWKTKVINIRALTVDDQKSLRMIRSRIESASPG